MYLYCQRLCGQHIVLVFEATLSEILNTQPPVCVTHFTFQPADHPGP